MDREDGVACGGPCTTSEGGGVGGGGRGRGGVELQLAHVLRDGAELGEGGEEDVDLVS